MRRIDDLDVAAARREFSVADMVEECLYKVHEDEPDDQAFVRILAELHAWAEHLRTTVAHRLDLIITLY